MVVIVDGYEFYILDTNSENDIVEYEKGLFKAFLKRSPGGWVSKHYTVIDNSRFRPKELSYIDLKVYGAKKNHVLIAASAVNFNNKNCFYEKKGFKIPEDNKNMKIVEGLNMYI